MFFEDVAVGNAAVFGSYAFTADNIKKFAREFDPQPFHVDEAAAKASHFGGLCASGWHTAAAHMKTLSGYMFRLRKEAAKRGEPLPELGPSPGNKNLRWPQPVFAGDVVTFSAVVTGKRNLASRPDWGLVTSDITGANQNDEVVFSVTTAVLVKRRAGAT